MKAPDITQGEWGFGRSPRSDIDTRLIINNEGIRITIAKKKRDAQAISAVPEMIDASIRIVYCYENDLGITQAEIEFLKQALLKAGCTE